ncbi:hypothetical protein [Stieleria varia]|uniref:Secreted protein n=1 Tax=Stieleria varia TaxID=2528005 RepID=A0A5C6AN21_9BACT|nr:hypothetical protein [Stieleria varia]TWU00887.1 hypothetical protein Pla52n_42560 [Stieleria varia]
MVRHTKFLVCASMLIGCSFAGAVEPAIRLADAQADASGKSKNVERSSKQNNDAREAPQVDETTEERVLEMVQSHLPELQRLLDQLRMNEPRQYRVAIQNLAKSAKRLEMAANRDPRFFELELTVIKSQTAVNLLIAKLKVRDSKSDRQALQKATEQIHDAETARAQYDVDQMQERLQRAQQQLAAAQKRLQSRQADRTTQIERSFAGNLRKAGRKDAPAPVKKTPAKESSP